MAKSKRPPHRVTGVYDTETNNIYIDGKWRAYPVLYILNDISNVDITAYEPGCAGETITFERDIYGFLDFVERQIDLGEEGGYIPVIAAYNLMFDLQPAMHLLRQRYDMRVGAQTATSCYYVDLIKDGAEALRFWDTFYLELNGLRAMGETCGFAKAVGDWDYSLQRTPDTPITDAEKGYAMRDVQVIPAYLRFILESNAWAKARDLGESILTKTSLVRQMARHDVYNRTYKNAAGKSVKCGWAFEKTCDQEKAPTYYQYALRKACFRAGFVFTSAEYANTVVRNVASLDVTSMHHLFINGRMLPVHFKPTSPESLQSICNQITGTPLHHVMGQYHKPFPFAVHALVRFDRLRLKKGSCFEKWGIAVIPEGKFLKHSSRGTDAGCNERAAIADEMVKAAGWHDKAVNPVFAFGKLYSADSVSIYVTEIELYLISLAYDYGGMHAILGESTAKFVRPPDYVTLQSNLLFELKSNMKAINKQYREGEPYPYDIPSTVPSGIAEGLKAGSLSNAFVSAYYSSTVKGSFNGIFGTQAQDVYKPDYTVDPEGDIVIARDTLPTYASWDDVQPRKNRVLYTYGMRIAGGSRLHIALGMMALYDSLGGAVRVTGGDTDSLKVSCDAHVTDDMLAAALQPLADAAKKAIDKVQERVRKWYPDLASELAGIGSFDVEGCAGADNRRYQLHMEAWNKARISCNGNHVSVTCAGLPRPEGAYTVNDAVADLMDAGISFEKLAPVFLGYDVEYDNTICHSLQKSRPGVADVFDYDVTDYLGRTSRVTVPESIALYNAPRVLGETGKRANYENVSYMRALGRAVDTTPKRIALESGKIRVYAQGDFEEVILYEAEAKRAR